MNDNINLAQVIALIKKLSSGSGEGGTSDYLDLINKPQINGIDLNGNKKLEDLGYPIFYWDGQSSDKNPDNITFWKKIISIAEQKTVLVIGSLEKATGSQTSPILLIIGPKDIDKMKTYPTAYNKFKSVAEVNKKGNNNSYNYFSTSWNIVTFSLLNEEIVSVSGIMQTATGNTNVLATNIDYTNPYEPQYAGSPATKQYVDNQIGDIATILDSINGEEV